ncbi:hypothetical protein CK203_012251 [Vitis vinifera]|uniref:Uncharacterized protein n=1 Tax=Vitis vinifera TaxID=29760 RepID=A0A438JKY4_VITVI|nr:hypothetical protein CK203_012251 [Vitis vinifera]
MLPVMQYLKSRAYMKIDHQFAKAGKVGSGFTQGESVSSDKVTACAKCNSKKGQKTLEEANMKLSKVPRYFLFLLHPPPYSMTLSSA